MEDATDMFDIFSMDDYMEVPTLELWIFSNATHLAVQSSCCWIVYPVRHINPFYVAFLRP